jgi:peptidyl-prolyl cis-trans isomerase B (cyclophilin B)
MQAVIETSKGTIHVDLFADKTPLTVANFVNLVQRGYYNGLNFHRVIPDFMVQGGCPQGSGAGGPGYRFEDEFVAELRHDAPGKLSMANAGPGTNGSQFFITHVPTPWLDDNHSIFGAVVSDADQAVVNDIAQGDKITSITIEGDVADLLAAHSERIDEWNSKLGD